MKVGIPGICLVEAHEEVVALLHDLQQTEEPAAMLTYEKVEGSRKAPIRVWKDGHSVIQSLWLSQLGTGAAGEVKYLACDSEDTAAPEDWEEHLSTEVIILKIHQSWVAAATWRLWSPPSTRAEVATRWLEKKGVRHFVEDIFHPKIFGEEPSAVATISLRVLISGVESLVKLTEQDPEDACLKILDGDSLKEVVWLGDVEPSEENRRRVIQKAKSIPEQRGFLLSEFGPGVRVPPDQHQRLAKVLLDDGTEAGKRAYENCVLRAHGRRWDVQGVPVDMSTAAVQAMLQAKAKWHVSVSYGRMSKHRGKKNWRVISDPQQEEPPEQFPHRGGMILIRPAPPPKKKGVPIERKPRKQNQEAKAGSQQQKKQQQPQWTKEYKPQAPKGPSWAWKSYAHAVAGDKEKEGAPEGEEFQEAEVEMEEEAGFPPSPDKAAGVTGAFSAAAKPTSRPPAAHGGPAMSPLEAQLAALLPTLMKMAAAFEDKSPDRQEDATPDRRTRQEDATPQAGFGPATPGPREGGAAAARAAAAPYQY
jgi:hypothetical protein